MRRRRVFAERAPWRVAEEMLDVAGIGHEPADPTVASVLVSNRPDRVEAAIAGVLAQAHRTRLVVGCHGFAADAVRRMLEGATVRDEPIVIEFDGSWPLGRCLNHAIASTPDPVIAKIDDDDHYGPAYLTDAVQALRYGGSPLVGKGAVFVYLEGRDTTYLRRPEVVERLHTGTPNGGTLVFRRGLWESIPFPHRTVGEDVAFVEAAKRTGAIPYAPSPWEYVYRRGTGTNTWQAVDDVFLDGAVMAWSGDDPTRADV
jgi:hypothetical protein